MTPFYKARTVSVCLLLIAVTIFVYRPVKDYGFVDYDDNQYVYENRHVQKGLTLDGAIWAFSTVHASNWHPLTWLSHMLDCELFGSNAGLHHLTNLVFHVVNALLLLVILRRMTGDFWQSSVVAGLFALHPMHVESVAWIAERKDVLCTVFWMLTIWGYISWVERPNAVRYVSSLSFFALGLMAKPMVVTLPFVLILLDFWPLGRLKNNPPGDDAHPHWRTLCKLTREKLPFFMLTAASCAVTFYAQNHRGVVVPLAAIPFGHRVANAFVSYANYLIKMFYPFRLAVLYPHPGTLPWATVTGTVLLFVLITLLAVKSTNKAPWFTVGWFWFAGTLVPVIGLVQVGRQAMADRYAYIPLIGLFIIIAWGVGEFMKGWPGKKGWLAVLSIALFSASAQTTRGQIQYWKNSMTLFTHALDVNSNNWLAHYSLGLAFSHKGRTDDAIDHYRQSLRINPNYEKALINLGLALFHKGQTDDAIRHYRQALSIRPDLEKAHNNLGTALLHKGRTDDAIECYRRAIRINPDYAKAHYNVGLALFHKGQTDEAIRHYLRALGIRPDYVDAHNNLAAAFFRRGNVLLAVKHLREAIQLDPNDVDARKNLTIVLMLQKKKE